MSETPVLRNPGPDGRATPWPGGHARGRAELRQSTANVLQLPGLFAVVLLAIVIRQLFVHPPSTIILGVCAGLAALDTVANGPVGSEYTGYALKLRDNATGKEVYAGAFGRSKVQQACESQGWSFS